MIPPSTNRPRRIQIQANQPVQSATTGQLTENWVVVASAWTLGWSTGGGTYTHVANEPRADDAATIRIRWRSDVAISPVSSRIVCNGRTYGIVSVVDVNEQHQYLDLSVRASA